MAKRRSPPDRKLPQSPAALTAPSPPPGFSYAREQDARPQRLKALHGEHPIAKCPELARHYAVAYGVPLKPAMVAAALRQAGVHIREELRQEFRARTARLVAIVNTMPSPTRDAVAAAYRQRYGIALPYDRISVALRDVGIRLVEPPRPVDRDEVEARPFRLAELAEDHPAATYDQLGQQYNEKYGVRLCPSTVAFAFHKLAVHRHRVADPDEYAARSDRLKGLAERHPDLGVVELAHEYRALYATELHPGTVQHTLNRLGLYRLAPVNASEVALRPERVQTLAEQHPTRTCAQLAHDYERRYGVALSEDSVEQALRSRGRYRQRPTDPQEFTKRPERLKKLLRENPALTERHLAELYLKEYGVALRPSHVSKALTKEGIFRKKTGTAEELRSRGTQLQKIYAANPRLTFEQLAQEYGRAYGIAIKPRVVARTLNRLGIYHSAQPTVAGMAERVAKLTALAAECPHLNTVELVKEYGRRYGEALDAHSTRDSLRRRGVYQSRAAVAEARVERLKAIAAECPLLSKTDVIREYARRHGEELSIPATLATLRRRGVVDDR